ncbi:hypothetical protein [Aquipuribacter sp. MA13-6]|uniref:hypothetical protein n=1 Tax=unclassified Aquipuribacter TaxID=2635084 RepID=UPI003EEC546A
MTRYLQATGTVAALLLLTACGADDGATTGDGAAGACLEGATDCADMPTGTGGPESGPDGSLPVADALAAGVEGPFLMSGYYLDDGDGARLCEALAESFPPQCGGASIALDESGATVGAATVGAATTTEGDVSWTDEPVPVEGEIVGGVFVVGAP